MDVRSGTIYAVYNTIAGGSNTLATSATAGAGTYRTTDTPDNLFDDNIKTRYSSQGNSTSGNNAYAGLNTGFYATIAQCQPVLIGFRFANGYPYPAREPLRVTVEGTNCADVQYCTNWTLLYNGTTGLDVQVDNYTYGEYQSIPNSNVYKSYRFLVINKRNSSNYVTYNEVQLFGYSNQTISNVNTTSSNIVH